MHFIARSPTHINTATNSQRLSFNNVLMKCLLAKGNNTSNYKLVVAN